MHYLVAVTPPADVVSGIDRFLESCHTATKRLSWCQSQPATYYLILASMADHPGHRVEELIQVLDEWAGRRTPLAMSITDASGLRGPEHTKVLYLGVPGTATVQLKEWFRQLQTFVVYYGDNPGGTGFRVHVTIVRTQCAQSAGHLLQTLDTYESQEFAIDEVVLAESHLANRTHKVLYRVILRG